MRIALVGVPYQMDVARWGYALGPQAFLDSGLLGLLEGRGHRPSEAIWIDLPRAERTRDTVTNLGRIAARTAVAVRTSLAQGADLVIVLEGDCTHAVGALGGLEQALGTPGVVWFDAHGDLHTLRTTTSGYIGGMPYAVALGWDLDDWRLAAGLARPVRPQAAALLGTSDLDAAEAEALLDHPLLHRTAQDLAEPEAAALVATALAARAEEAHAWYLHLDLDVAGPDEAPGGMTPAPTWPPRAQLIAAVGAAAGAVPVRVLSLATYNPGGDPTGRGAQLGLDLLAAVVASLEARASDTPR